MGNINEIRVVLGSLRYKSAPNTNLVFQAPLMQTSKENVEFDRTIDINLQQVFDDERQLSDIIRPTCKFSVLFKNSYSGSSQYEPFTNNLYYLNSEISAANNCPTNSNVVWPGLPQYNEFDFIRNDFNVPGYTQPPNEHILFVPQSASTYNWNFFVSYAFENNYNKPLQVFDNRTNQTINWVSSDGIPFIIENTTYNGNNIISFRCSVKHGMSVGEFAKLSFSYNGVDKFQIDSLGNGAVDSEYYYFNIINVGYTGTTFNSGVYGTAKRVILSENESDTISKYYVRRHKILTDVNNSVMTKCGFEQNIFGEKKRYESSGFTPNYVSRVSIKEGAQSYNLSFNEDVLINPLRDNQMRPISELFFTVIWKGYFGWTLGLSNGQGIKQGYEFNLPLNNSQSPNSWWANSYSNSNSGIPKTSYTTPLGTHAFFYNESLKSGDTIDGDFCEWNDYEQKERVISDFFHKIRFNNTQFTMSGPQSNPLGYYYKPHHKLTIREYSDYIEEGDIQNVVGIPDYAHFSTTKNLFIWRDLYPYGFIDTNNIGVDYPFLNGTHYPYNNYIFRIIPEGTNYNEQTIIADPTIDNCE